MSRGSWVPKVPKVPKVPIVPGVRGLRLASDLRDPPAKSDEQETPVFEELRGLAFDVVSDELEDPAHHENYCGRNPERGHHEAGDCHQYRNDDHRNSEGMAEPIHRMLVTGCVLRDPLGHRPIAKHAAFIHPP